ncbi:MAG: 50S ribosomal protein L6 [Pseudomonadota bacterium]|nr:50S ribosomal protein L6 [Pseudomonadota bacterium]
MSRIAKEPVVVPKGVEITLDGSRLQVKGKNGALDLQVHEDVNVQEEGGRLQFSAQRDSRKSRSLAATMRTLANNMVRGVSEGFERRLQLVGVGYRAQVQGKTLNLSLGFSHPVEYPIPEGLTIETPSQTEIVVKGSDKQLVGQVAAEIREFRPPEPYKGKGVRYAGERVVMKEAKKK